MALLSAAQGVTVSVSPPEANGTGGGSVVTTNSVTVSVLGGTPSGYEWVKQSGDTIIASLPNSSTTTFSGVGMASPEARSANFVCNVTVNGVVYPSPSVPVMVERP